MTENLTALTAPERETIVTGSDADPTVHVWTAQRRHITRMRRDPAFTEQATGFHGGTEWAEFTTSSDWSPVTGRKRTRKLTPEQRKTMADRLAATRDR